MRNYDLSVLFDTKDGEEGAKALFTKLEDIITKAKGNYICFLDCDDVFVATKLEIQINTT